MSKEFLFDHEKLFVYQESLDFVKWVDQILKQCEGRAAVKDQLDRASTSIILNLAEGNGKFAIRDRCRFLDIACGSAVECAACLDVLVAKSLLTSDLALEGKRKLNSILSKLIALKQSVLARLREEESIYAAE